MNNPWTFLRRLVRPPAREEFKPNLEIQPEPKEITDPERRYGRISIHLKPSDPQQGERAFNRDVTKEQWSEILRILGAKN